MRKGTAQIHVVDSLTSLTVTRKSSSTALSSLTVDPGEQIQLAVSGSYWGRTALRGWDKDAVTCTVSGDIGSVDETGLFTVSSAPTRRLHHHFRRRAEPDHHRLPRLRPQRRDPRPLGLHRPWNTATPTTSSPGSAPRSSAGTTRSAGGTSCSCSTTPWASPPPPTRPTLPTCRRATTTTPPSPGPRRPGLATGTGDGAYSPTAPVTREQAFTILRQALPLLGKNCPDGDLSVLDQFSDKDQIADYAKGHTATLVSQGLVSGKGDGIDPKGNLTRAEMAAILYKAITFTPIDPSVDPSQYTLSLDVTQMILAPGDSTALTASLSPAYENAAITWTSSDPAAAVVSSSGVVTSVYAGSSDQVVTITASWQGLSASCFVVCTSPRQVGTVHDAELGLNVRSGPDTSYSIIGSLKEGGTVAVLGEENGWYRVAFADNKARPSSVMYPAAI